MVEVPVSPSASVTVTVRVPALLELAVKVPEAESMLPRFVSLTDQVNGVVAPLAENVV